MGKAEKMEVEVSTAISILVVMAHDIEQIERYWPVSKRGSNATRAFEAMKERRAVALQCLMDAIREPSDA